jgi:hypothetical protein
MNGWQLSGPRSVDRRLRLPPRVDTSSTPTSGMYALSRFTVFIALDR